MSFDRDVGNVHAAGDIGVALAGVMREKYRASARAHAIELTIKSTKAYQLTSPVRAYEPSVGPVRRAGAARADRVLAFGTLMMCWANQGPRVAPTFRRRERLAAGGVRLFTCASATGTYLFVNTRDRGSSAWSEPFVRHWRIPLATWIRMSAALSRPALVALGKPGLRPASICRQPSVPHFDLIVKLTGVFDQNMQNINLFCSRRPKC